MRCFVIVMAMGVLYPATNASANSIEQINDTHERCTSGCETRYQRAIDRLPCDPDATKSTYDRCNNPAEALRDSCLSPCNSARTSGRRECSDAREADEQACKDYKKDEKKACRVAKRAEKKDCRQAKKDEKEICKDMSGQAKRQCKKDARQMKKDCKKLAKETKKACKSDVLAETEQCEEDVVTDNENCRDTVAEAYSSCSSPCHETYNSTCVEERRANNECQALKRPIVSTRDECISDCNQTKSDRMANHNPLCPSEHRGEEGAVITINNTSGETRFFYIGAARVTAIPNGGTYEQNLACNVDHTLHFKREDVDDYDYTGLTQPLQFPCCREAQEQTIYIPD